MKKLTVVSTMVLLGFVVIACEMNDTADQLFGVPSINGRGSSEYVDADLPFLVDSGSDSQSASEASDDHDSSLSVQDASVEDASDACVQETDRELCEKFETNCGPVQGEDKCGWSRAVISCGSCQSPKVCISGKCTGCVPKTCDDGKFTCGYVSDGCGGSLACGNCPVDGTQSVCATSADQTAGVCKTYKEVCPATSYLGSCTNYKVVVDPATCATTFTKVRIVERFDNKTPPTPNYGCSVDYSISYDCGGNQIQVHPYVWSAFQADHAGSIGGISVGSFLGGIGFCEEKLTWYFSPTYTTEEIKQEAQTTAGAKFVLP